MSLYTFWLNSYPKTSEPAKLLADMSKHLNCPRSVELYSELIDTNNFRLYYRQLCLSNVTQMEQVKWSPPNTIIKKALVYHKLHLTAFSGSAKNRPVFARVFE